MVATYGGAKKLVNRLDDENTVGAKLGTKLKKELKAAKRADTSGDERQARKALQALQEARLAGRRRRGEEGAQAPVAHR